MISYGGWPVYQIIFSWHGTTLQRTWQNVILITIIGLITNVICQFTGYVELDTSAQQMPLIFVAILLVFRTGYAYNRFMEGRGHVGSMVFNVRDLARMVGSFVVGEDEETNFDRSNVVRLLQAFVISNRLSCRKQEMSNIAELEEHLTTQECARLRELKKNFPLIILQWVGQALAKFKNKQNFARALDTMEEKVGELMAAWMGMQKLATTPFPFPYAQMCTFFLYLWCYTCPIALSISDQWFGAAIATVVGFALFGINCIALELEDPFGGETNDLDLEFFEGAAMGGCKALLPPKLDPKKLESISPGVGSEGVYLQGNVSAAPGVVPPVAQAPAASSGDPLAIATRPGFAEQAQKELLAGTNLGSLSPDVQTVLKGFFDRYDLNGNGRIDSGKELTQMVTNIAFGLKMGAGLPQLLEAVESVGDVPDWNIDVFVEWFITQAKPICANGATASGPMAM